MTSLWQLSNSMEPQHHSRMSQVGRDHSSSPGPTSLLKQSHPGAHGTGLNPDGLGISPERETPHPLWVICSVLGYLHNKEILFQVQPPMQWFLPRAPCLLLGYLLLPLPFSHFQPCLQLRLAQNCSEKPELLR